MGVTLFVMSILVFLASLGYLRDGRRQDASVAFLASTIPFSAAAIASATRGMGIRDTGLGFSIFLGLGFLTQLAERLWTLRQYGNSILPCSRALAPSDVKRMPHSMRSLPLVLRCAERAEIER